MEPQQDNSSQKDNNSEALVQQDQAATSSEPLDQPSPSTAPTMPDPAASIANSTNLPNAQAEPTVIAPQNGAQPQQQNITAPIVPTDSNGSPNNAINYTSPEPSQQPVQNINTAQPEQPIVANSFAAPPPPKSKKSKKPLLVALMIFLAIILVGSLSAYAYIGVYVPNKPNNVIKQAAVNAFSPNTLNGIAVKATINNKDNPSDPSVITIVGGKKNDLIRADFTADISAFKITGSVITNSKDDTIYLKINELPTLINMWGINDAKIANNVGNKWIKVSPSDLNELGATQQGDALSNDKCVSATTKILTSDSFKNDLVKLYQGNEFAAASKVAKEQVNGKNTTKYKIDINESKLNSFTDQLEKSFNSSLKAIESTCVEKESASTSADTADLLSDTDYKDLYVWVGPKKQVEKLEVSFTDKDGGGKLEVLFNQSNKLEFTVPTDVTTLKSILEEIEKSFSNSTNFDDSIDYNQTFDFGVEPFN